jgi:hypothetical protein
MHASDGGPPALAGTTTVVAAFTKADVKRACLNRPVEAMRTIRAALKPGGVMVCEEADVSAVYAEPPAACTN